MTFGQEIALSRFSGRLHRARRWQVMGAICAALLALPACAPNGPAEPPVSAAVPAFQGAPAGVVEAQPLDGATGAAANPGEIGNGPVHVGLILPMTQNGASTALGASLRNSAELALDEAHSKDVTLVVEDDQSTPDGAKAATQAALSQGVSVLIGPLFAASVREAANAARAAGTPMIAFSTDASVAGQGVYLLSFLVETYVDRIVDYSVAHGKKSFAALIPNSDYGRVAEAEFLQETARLGASVRDVEHYDAGKAGAAIPKIAASLPSIDALFIPEQADAMTSIGPLLAANGIDSKRVQILGTGLWSDARVLNLPALQGAMFAAPDNSGFVSFAANYRAKFGTDPTRIATLAHDAVALAVALARTQGSQAFTPAVLTATSGFRGVDGVFRFRPDGLNDRGLAVVQIKAGSTVVLSAAPRSFAAKPQG